MKHVDELYNVCSNLQVESRVLTTAESERIIQTAFKRFEVGKKSGHLAIHFDSISVPLSDYEFRYATHLEAEPVYVFFDQENNNRNSVIRIENGQKLGDVMAETHGMEYFVTNVNYSFLLAINWYVIEGAGTSTNWLQKLIP